MDDMDIKITVDDLKLFEQEIANLFINKKIKSPIHLSDGNESILIDIFKMINENDYVFSTHRNHLHAILKGINREWLKKQIIDGHSMHINSKHHKFFTSSIVGGTLPIALGVSMAIKKKRKNDKVWVFIGDMGAETGIFHECTKYANRNNLPIVFVVEDNGLSVECPTNEVWGLENKTLKIIKYKYNKSWPHVGCGKWVQF